MLAIIGKDSMLAASFRAQIAQCALLGREIDLFDKAALKAWLLDHHITYVINCVAYTQVDRAEEEREDAYRLNVQLPRLLAEVCQEMKIGICHFSTDYVFDGYGNCALDESCEPNPQNYYGLTKLLGEQALCSVHATPLIVRTSWLYGHHKTPFPKVIWNRLKQCDEIRVVADQIGSPSYCEDVASSTLSLLSTSGIFHVAGSGHTSWYGWAKQLIDEVEELSGKTLIPISHREYPQKAIRPLFTPLVSIKLREKLPHWQIAFAKYIRREI